MKKHYILSTFILFALVYTLPAQTSSSIDLTPAATEEPKRTDEEISASLTARLMEIKDMDKTGMTRMEKKELRKEVKEINNALKVSSGGVYLSVGAIILIALLLILLL